MKIDGIFYSSERNRKRQMRERGSKERYKLIAFQQFTDHINSRIIGLSENILKKKEETRTMLDINCTILSLLWICGIHRNNTKIQSYIKHVHIFSVLCTNVYVLKIESQ